MKNRNRLAGTVVLLVLITLFSCKKDYTCTCNTYDRGTGKFKRSSIKTGKMTKDRTKTWCKDIYANANYTQCTLN